MAGEEDTTLLTTNYHLESLSGEIVSRSVPRDELVVLAPAISLPGPVDFVKGEALYAVEAISESRAVKGRCELLVKWDGYVSPSWVLELDVPIEIRKKLWSLSSKYHHH